MGKDNRTIIAVFEIKQIINIKNVDGFNSQIKMLKKYIDYPVEYYIVEYSKKNFVFYSFNCLPYKFKEEDIKNAVINLPDYLMLNSWLDNKNLDSAKNNLNKSEKGLFIRSIIGIVFMILAVIADALPESIWSLNNYRLISLCIIILLLIR